MFVKRLSSRSTSAGFKRTVLAVSKRNRNGAVFRNSLNSACPAIPVIHTTLSRYSCSQPVGEVVGLSVARPELGIRTHDCGTLGLQHVGQQVILSGWLRNTRVLGPHVFSVVSDAFGSTQLILPDESHQSYETIRSTLKNLPLESVIRIEGTVVARPNGQQNPQMISGAIEVVVNLVEVVNRSPSVLPLRVDRKTLDTRQIKSQESNRLQHRFLDLRGAFMQRNLRLRSAVALAARTSLSELGFTEVETPTLFKSTPEGAREFLVPTRNYPGHFYALPQSPQQYKQTLMASGIDRYFQLARCYRDEGTRADRQPEFTQLDVEMSFATQEHVMGVTEIVVEAMWKAARLAATKCAVASCGPVPSNLDELKTWESIALPAPLQRLHTLNIPFPRLTYFDALSKYGTDKPDTRLGLELVDLSNVLSDEMNCAIHGFVAPGLGGVMSKKANEQLLDIARAAFPDYLTNSEPGEWGIAVVNVTSGSAGAEWGRTVLKGDLGKKLFAKNRFVAKDTTELFSTMKCEPGDLLVVATSGADHSHRVEHCWALGAARVECAMQMQQHGLCSPPDPSDVRFLWVTDFPMFEPGLQEGVHDESNENSLALSSVHHPFTAPTDNTELVVAAATELEDVRTTKLLSLTSQSYDLVCNGSEVGGGSVRIHDHEIQKLVFEDVLRLPQTMLDSFEHLLTALSTGCPQHAGIALGFDRFISMLCDTAGIRDVTAFPKTSTGQELMTGSPSKVSEKQLEEYHIRISH